MIFYDKGVARMWQQECGTDRSSHRHDIIVTVVVATVARDLWLRFFVTKTVRKLKRIRDAGLVNRQSRARDATFNSYGHSAKGANQYL